MPYYCKLVYFVKVGTSDLFSNKFAHGPESRDFFVWETWNIARLVSGVTLIPDFIQSTRVDGYLCIFFVLCSSTQGTTCTQQHVTSQIQLICVY